MAQTDKLAAFFHHRWSVPLVCALYAGRAGARLVTLSHAVGGNRDALRPALDALIAGGIVMRNPGYGHPLRPEYLLTPLGRRIAPACVRFEQVVQRIGALAVAYLKWSAPALVAMRRGHTRFNEIQRALGTITPRSLTQGLRLLSDCELVIRSVDDGFPPRSSYALSANGVAIADAAQGIDRKLA